MKTLLAASINVDYIQFVKDFPQPGETLFAECTLIKPGGKGLNVGRFLTQLNSDVQIVGCVGDDVNSTIIKNAL